MSVSSDSWIDWTVAIDSFAEDGDCAYVAYDNLPIKAYLYPLGEILKVHQLEEGAETSICPECGYVLAACG